MHGNIAGAPAKALPFPASPSYLTHVRQCIFLPYRQRLTFAGICLSFFNSTAVRIPTPDFSTYVFSSVCTKEVIRLQVPLQPPCYDFSPLAELRFDHHNMR